MQEDPPACEQGGEGQRGLRRGQDPESEYPRLETAARGREAAEKGGKAEAG